jgi:hypothetical protein
MPKLNGIQILERLMERLAQLEAGEEIAAKEIRSLLTPEQQQELEDAWKEQQELRKGKRARTAEEEKELGWKSKREVRIEVFKRAVSAADSNLEKELVKREAEIARRQLRIYFDALDEAKEKGKDATEAKNYANNELTRAGLQRMDYKQKLVEEIKQKREIERYMRLTGGKKD